MTRISRIKKRIREHREKHEAHHREKMQWIQERRAQWEADCRQGWGRAPWMSGDPRSVRPMRHWFFMKIFMVLFWTCAAFCIIQFFTNSTFSAQKIPQYLAWAFGIMLVAFLMLRKMFGPLRILMQGVREISKGNLDFQFPMKRQHGEINYLAENFNLMVKRIKEMIQAKDQLLLDVSHELRSPLTRLKLALEMSPESKLKSLMLQDVIEMETMLTEILETQRLSNGNGHLTLEEVDLALLVRDVVAKYQERKPGVSLLDVPQSLVAKVDGGRIRRVLQNLLENALKFSDKQKNPVEVCLRGEEGRIVLSVMDFGVGIPPEDHEKVFEPFYRVDKSRTKDTGGYGLGLSLCREIIRAHGGDVRLESQVGQGTLVLAEWPSRSAS